MWVRDFIMSTSRSKEEGERTRMEREGLMARDMTWKSVGMQRAGRDWKKFVGVGMPENLARE